jgi:D-amino-acid oxidase
VLLLERREALARETTARNSEVIHSGIYYPAGSLKASLCVRGRELLYARCERDGIPHRRLGKWIVAVDAAETAQLEALKTRGDANGAPGLRMLAREEIERGEPALRVAGALESPATGIVDARAFCLSLAAEAEAHGAVIVLRSEVLAIERSAVGYRVAARASSGERAEIACGAVVNAAGLESDALAARAGIDVTARGYQLHPCKGDYFALAPSVQLAVSRLVYPVPAGPGLGVHVTLDLGGRLRFGPDAEYVPAPRYDVDAAKAERFAAAVSRYLPGVRADWLVPDYAGVRPKLAGPGVAFRDFVVQEESGAGLPGFVNLIGIESPGLTAALAIGERVAALLASV